VNTLAAMKLCIDMFNILSCHYAVFPTHEIPFACWNSNNLVLYK